MIVLELEFHRILELDKVLESMWFSSFICPISSGKQVEFLRQRD